MGGLEAEGAGPKTGVESLTAVTAELIGGNEFSHYRKKLLRPVSKNAVAGVSNTMKPNKVWGNRRCTLRDVINGRYGVVFAANDQSRTPDAR
jgi:hypothetical protein